MEKLKISVHPTFIIFAGILAFFNKGLLLLIYLIVLIVHEMAHAIVAKKLGYLLKDIKIIPFGICLNISSLDLKPDDEIKIAIAGPLINLILSIILVSLWWFVPSLYNYTNIFCYANLITCVFNLIPAFPLDGGRIVLALLKKHMNGKKAILVCKLINICVCISLLILFFVSCFFQINFTYLLVIFCVASGIFENNKKRNYSIINFSLRKKFGNVIKIKTLCINVDEKMFKVCKYIDRFSYLQIYLFDKNKNLIISKLFENEFLKLLENKSTNLTFKEALNLK